MNIGKLRKLKFLSSQLQGGGLYPYSVNKGGGKLALHKSGNELCLDLHKSGIELS